MIYDSQYYRNRKQNLHDSVTGVISVVTQWIHPQSVLDVGCGQGHWLASWKKCEGITKTFGVDGSWVSRDELVISPDEFRHLDLETDRPELGPFDLVQCLEVAEHLDPKAAAGFVRWLCKQGPMVLFSAAVPGQGGTGHVNEQWPDYWEGLFKDEGFVRFDIIRKSIWEDHTVRWWYRQNAFLFVHEPYLALNSELTHQLESADGSPEHVVHPEMLLAKLDEHSAANLPAQVLVKFALRSVVSAVKRRIPWG